MTDTPAGLDEVQSGLLAVDGKPHAARMLFLRFDDAVAARTWLSRIQHHISFGPAVPPGDPHAPRRLQRAQIAFTHAGLQVLLGAGAALDAFPDAFRQGMAKRAKRLGDPSTPRVDRVPGSERDEPAHAVLTVFVQLDSTRDEDEPLHELLLAAGRWARTRDKAPSLEELRTRLAEQLSGVVKELEPQGAHEAGVDVLHTKDLHRPLWEDADKPDAAGQPREYGVEYFGFRDGLRRSEPPLSGNRQHFIVQSSEPLLHDGSYLVMRQLEQDVQGFWRSMDEAAGQVAPSSGRDVAEHVMGMHVDGSLLEPSDGSGCPFQSHVRRVNPLPTLPLDQNPRIVRRGMPYVDADDKVGLMFMAYGADLASQFELIQRSWVQRGNHVGGSSRDRDPIAGLLAGGPQAAQAERSSFSCSVAGRPLTQRFAPFATLRWGDYFFAPSRSALALLASAQVRIPAAPAERPAMAAALAAAGSVDAQKALVRGWLDKTDSAATFWRHAEQVGGVRVGDWVFAAHPDDAHDIMADDGSTFSVAEYARRMRSSTGEFFLGMDANTQRYRNEHESAAIIPQDAREIQRIAAEATCQIMVSCARRGKLRKASEPESPARILLVELIAYVLDRVTGQLIGLPGPGYTTFASWGGDVATYHFRVAADSRDAARVGISVLSYRAHVDRCIREAEDPPREEGQPLENVALVSAQRATLRQKLAVMRKSLPGASHEDLARNLLNIVTGSLGATIKLTKNGLLAYAQEHHDANGYISWPQATRALPTERGSLFSLVIADSLTRVRQGGPDSLYRQFVGARPRRLRKPSDGRQATGEPLRQGDIVVAWIGGALARHGAGFLFGAGPHACPGTRMGMAIIDGILQALRPYEIKLVEEPDETYLELSDQALVDIFEGKGLWRAPEPEVQTSAPGLLHKLASALTLAAVVQKLRLLQLRERYLARRLLP
jgi:cytochrome P450